MRNMNLCLHDIVEIRISPIMRIGADGRTVLRKITIVCDDNEEFQITCFEGAKPGLSVELEGEDHD